LRTYIYRNPHSTHTYLLLLPFTTIAEKYYA